MTNFTPARVQTLVVKSNIECDIVQKEKYPNKNRVEKENKVLLFDGDVLITSLSNSVANFAIALFRVLFYCKKISMYSILSFSSCNKIPIYEIITMDIISKSVDTRFHSKCVPFCNTRPYGL